MNGSRSFYEVSSRDIFALAAFTWVASNPWCKYKDVGSLSAT